MNGVQHYPGGPVYPGGPAGLLILEMGDLLFEGGDLLLESGDFLLLTGDGLPRPTSSASNAPLLKGDFNANNAAST